MKQLIRRLSSLRVAKASSQYELLRSNVEERRRGGTAPEGHVPVFVGEEMERFEVQAELLSHPIFRELLRRSAQEYGYEQSGVLRIPCPVMLFKRALAYLLESDSRDEMDNEILRYFDDIS